MSHFTPKVGTHRVGDTVSLGDWGDWLLRPDHYAVMYTRDGRIVDVAFTRATAESMVLEGYLASIITEVDAATWQHKAAEWQAGMDALAAQYEDCWGVA